MIQIKVWFSFSLLPSRSVLSFFAVFDYYKKITQPACAGDHACLGIVGVMFGRYEVLVYTTGAPNKLLRYIAVRDMLISPSDFRITIN